MCYSDNIGIYLTYIRPKYITILNYVINKKREVSGG